MAKEPNELKWIENLLPEGEYRRKGMFGGFAYYLGEKIVLLTFESPGGSTYQGRKYPFEIWNGCMFPVEREHQAKALQRFPFLVSHPILPKWLYLPLKTESFDDLVSEVLAQAIKPNGYWGSIPKGKSKKSPKTSGQDFVPEKMDTRTPRMFSDEPAVEKLKKARKISDLKNLGAVSEREFGKVGIKSAQQFIALGWKKTWQKLIQLDPKNRHSLYGYALIGALTNTEFNRITDREKQEARDFVKSLPTKKKKAIKKTHPK